MPGPTLLCYDGSPDADAAIQRAGVVLGGGPAVVATVWSPVHADRAALAIPGVDSHVRDAVDELDRIGAKQALETAEKGCGIARDAGFSPEPLALKAQHAIWAALVDAAEQRDATMLVLGRRGLSPVAAAVLGSVSHGVLNHARRPVLVVPREESHQA